MENVPFMILFFNFLDWWWRCSRETSAFHSHLKTEFSRMEIFGNRLFRSCSFWSVSIFIWPCFWRNLRSEFVADFMCTLYPVHNFFLQSLKLGFSLVTSVSLSNFFDRFLLPYELSTGFSRGIIKRESKENSRSQSKNPA